MKKIITEELGYMKYLLGYTRGVVISEQPTPAGYDNQDDLNKITDKLKSFRFKYTGQETPDVFLTPGFTPITTPWEDVVKYYEGNKDPNWKFNKKKKIESGGKMYDFVKVDSTDANDANAYMDVYDDGDVYIFNKGQGTSYIRAKWEWNGTKPVIKFKDISKNASGYVQPTDTDWSAVTENNKIIGLNAKGPLVKEVQRKLINIGYSGTTSGSITTDVEGCKADVVKCDGIYGPTTKEMVKQYQKDNNGLSVDGIVGQQTYDAMFKHLN